MDKMIKYVLVSQGIKLFDTLDKEEAEEFTRVSNISWNKYVKRCLKKKIPYADNEVFLFTEEVE